MRPRLGSTLLLVVPLTLLTALTFVYVLLQRSSTRGLAAGAVK